MRCPHCQEPVELPARFCPACGVPLAEPPDPLLGAVLGGRFRVERLIAEGGMGRVYAAIQEMGGRERRVAIKVLLSDISNANQDVTRFMRECSTVAELEHPNTIKFYDYGQTPDGDLYIAMEFLAGRSLAEELGTVGVLSPDRADLIVGQICGSLQEAHDKSIVHRDLKPDNVILTRAAGQGDFVKVLDFGIAKRVDGRDPKLTPLGVVLGSPPYMSPEQFTMQEIDARSDIYSLGVLTYQALTGKMPFEAREMLHWATLHMAEPPLPIEATPLGATIPPSMQRAVMRALEKRPEDRQSSMREFFGEFTVSDRRSLPAGRASSIVPFSLGQLSSAPPRFGSSSAGASSAAPTLVDEVDRDPVIPPPSALPRFEPEAAGAGGVPELVPPTVRDPTLTDPPPSEGRRVGLMVALAFGIAVVGAVTAFAVLSHLGRTRGDEPAPGRTGAPDAPPAEVPSTLPTEVEPPVNSATERPSVDPCEAAVAASVSGQCERAERWMARCDARSPNRPAAARTVDRLCKP